MASTLGLVSIGCALSTVGVAVSWATRRTDGLGRPRGFPLASVSVLMVLAVLTSVPAAQRRLEEHRLARVGAVLAGAPVTVHCQTTTGSLVDTGAELGFVRGTADGGLEHATTLKRDPCRALASYIGGDHEHPSRDEVVSVHVLTHESMHMRGERSETAAECEAMQRDALTARLLGASPTAARALATAYWAGVYPFMPDDYRTTQCRPGGPLDEHLGTPPWSP